MPQARAPGAYIGWMGTTREPMGWRSSVGRLIVLILGWAFAGIALVVTIYGVVNSVGLLMLVGAALGLASLAIAKMIPEPIPALRRADRRREQSVREYSGHRLPS